MPTAQALPHFATVLPLCTGHTNYEAAARCLLMRQKERLQAAHERELRRVRAELEAQHAREKTSVEVSAKQAEGRAEESRRSLVRLATSARSPDSPCPH